MGERLNSKIDRIVIIYARIACSITLFDVLVSAVGYYFPNLGHDPHACNGLLRSLIDVVYYLLIASAFNLPLLLIAGFYLVVYKYFELGIICICSCLLFYFLTLRVLADSFV